MPCTNVKIVKSNYMLINLEEFIAAVVFLGVKGFSDKFLEELNYVTRRPHPANGWYI